MDNGSTSFFLAECLNLPYDNANNLAQERLVTLIEHFQLLAFLNGVNPHDDHVAEVAGMITGTSFLQTQWTQLNGMEKLAHSFIPLFVNGLFALVSL
ncbi:hypothetical protein FOXG_21630 [Fusarium oxysporum f. sp. lycopersici 4287]|uniref:Uncharacterized protein n=1 Tax=Fusarium oxysporum f. sp. lycopersici (strain 4287 / CBS 123668 / FGSC 9935 / NRRL 34936) TaxID=426428 RepID=A0A0J9W0M9_FUSO4|nr:hypothetical protein FOXG_21630 [Fusarium oxysporum f. sp. lycopersici 4287]KNB16345.1 hypothetical protein FOXG_21630 [Fusarium oxysporum f. sp. lycopersici 4287]